MGAVADAFGALCEDTSAASLHLVVHPADTFSFLTPLSADLPVSRRQKALRHHAALLTQTRDPDGLRLHAETVRTFDAADQSERLMWVHVLAVPSAVEDRVATLTDMLDLPAPQWVNSTHAAIPVVAETELQAVSHEDALRPYSLAVGAYPTHTEYALAHNRTWYHSHVAVDATTDDDRAYYAVGMLNRLGIESKSIGRVFLYGPGATGSPSTYRSVFDRSPTIFDLRDVVAVQPEKRSNDDLSADLAPEFVPCVGATLLGESSG